MENNRNLKIASLFENLFLDHIDIPREEFVERINAFIPFLKALEQEFYQNKDVSIDKIKQSFGLECGFWIESRMPGQVASRINFSSSSRLPQFENAVETLKYGYEDIFAIPKFYSERITGLRFGKGSMYCLQLSSQVPSVLGFSVDKTFFENYRPREIDLQKNRLDKFVELSKTTSKEPELVGSFLYTLREEGQWQKEEQKEQIDCFPSQDVWEIFRNVHTYFLNRPSIFQFDKISVNGDLQKHCSDHCTDQIGTLLIGTNFPYGGGDICINGDEFSIRNGLYVFFYTDVPFSSEPVFAGSRVLLHFKVLLDRSDTRARFRYKTSKSINAKYYTSNITDFAEPCITSDDQKEEFLKNINRRYLYQADKYDQYGKKPDSMVYHVSSLRFSKTKIAFVLRHFYPQKPIHPDHLRDSDKEVYNQLKTIPFIKNLLLVPIRLCRSLSRYQMKIYAPKDIVQEYFFSFFF